MLNKDNINDHLASLGYDPNATARAYIKLIGIRLDPYSPEVRERSFCHAFELALQRPGCPDDDEGLAALAESLTIIPADTIPF